MSRTCPHFISQPVFVAQSFCYTIIMLPTHVSFCDEIASFVPTLRMTPRLAVCWNSSMQRFFGCVFCRRAPLNLQNGCGKCGYISVGNYAETLYGHLLPQIEALSGIKLFAFLERISRCLCETRCFGNLGNQMVEPISETCIPCCVCVCVAW